MASPYIPEDMVMDILARLPVTSLLRFRCVCKSWYVLIRNPRFITQHFTTPSRSHKFDSILYNHLRRHGTTMVSLLSSKTLDLSYDVPMPFFDDDSDDQPFILNIRGPCNGLVCLYGLCKIRHDDHNDNDVITPCACFQDDYYKISLWNPATREFKALPLSRVPLPPSSHVAVEEFGFGFDSKTNDYKVVRISYVPVDVNQVQVYTLRSNSWRKVDTIVPADTVMSASSCSTYSKGFYYWCARDPNNGDKYVILSFDMSNEIFQNISPPAITAKLRAVVLQEINGLIGFLALCITDNFWTMWLMNDDRSAANTTWIKKFTVDLDPGIPRVLGFCKDGDLLAAYRSEGMVTFSPTIDELGHYRVRGMDISFEVVMCKESLVSLSDVSCKDLSENIGVGECVHTLREEANSLVVGLSKTGLIKEVQRWAWI